MAYHQAKRAESFRKGLESNNECSRSYTESNACGREITEAGEPTPDSTLSRILAQLPKTVNRDWPSITERFWSAIHKTESCWLWTGTICRGYGYIGIGPGGRQVRFRAHRLSWMLHFGDIPEGLEVMHSCDNPACVRPAHLMLGTHQENIADAIRKGRKNCWGLQKLTAHDVHQIRAMRAAGTLQKDIAARFGVARNTVSQVLTGRNWRHLESPTPTLGASAAAPQRPVLPPSSTSASERG